MWAPTPLRASYLATKQVRLLPLSALTLLYTPCPAINLCRFFGKRFISISAWAVHATHPTLSLPYPTLILPYHPNVRRTGAACSRHEQRALLQQQ